MNMIKTSNKLQTENAINTIKSELKTFSSKVDTNFVESMEKFEKVFDKNTEIAKENLKSADSDLKALFQNYSKIEQILSNILSTQEEIFNELSKIEKNCPKPIASYSNQTIGSDEIENISLKSRLCSRHLSDTFKILTKPNPSKNFSTQENSEDILNEIERQIVFVI